MPRIKIVSTPEMLGIHERILEGWIGVELEAKEPYEHRGTRVYEVPVSAALEALRKNNEMAWRWFSSASMFRQNTIFLFPVECCIDL